MRFRNLAISLVSVIALAGVMVRNAEAAAVTQDATWRTGTSGSVLTGSEAISSTGSGEMVIEVGSTDWKLKYAGFECKECSIENAGGSAGGKGKLRFTEVTVVEPATCAVEGGAISTSEMRIRADYMSGSSNFLRFEPAEGSTVTTVRLIKGSGACAVAGTYGVSGILFGKTAEPTGVYSSSQLIAFSGAINAEAGGGLLWGSKPLEVRGSSSWTLSGSSKGAVFGTHE